MTRTLIILVALCLPSTARATPCTDTPRPCYLEAGEAAPWGGELWPSAFALAVLQDRADTLRARAALAQAQVDLGAERALREVDQVEAAAVLEAERKARVEVERLARALVEPAPWYERPSFVAPVSVALTMAMVLGVFYAMR